MMQRTRSAFSLGTRFANWPTKVPSWMQTYHLPLPVLLGVPFQQFLSARDDALEPYLISAQAALKGVFAHPPQDQRHPLSRSEYGYQFSVAELRELLKEMNGQKDIEFVSSDLRDVQVQDGDIEKLVLDDGREVEADLFVDCSGDARGLIGALDVSFDARRNLAAALTTSDVPQLGPPHRSLMATDHGWSASTPLQGRVDTLSIAHPNDRSETAAVEFQTGKLAQAWRGNCVAIGHAAWGLEPLTPAPMILLQRDIERALDLIPVTKNCRMEAQEYNRRFEDDFVHASIFQRALFSVEDVPETEYWQAATSEPMDGKLQRKLTQFKSRGLIVRYDLEPFNEEDWAILLNGMGVKPERYDLQVDGIEEATISGQLDGLQRAIAQVISKMPPHHIYMTNMKRYLEKQRHG